MALAQISEIEENKLPERAAKLSEFLLPELAKIECPGSVVTARGVGLMAGLDVRLPNGAPNIATAMHAIKAMLHRGFILLPEGEHGNVISFTPPLTITKAQLAETFNALAEVLHETV
jgi:4-aminobutyrate aminotransferase-like enzyme